MPLLSDQNQDQSGDFITPTFAGKPAPDMAAPGNINLGDILKTATKNPGGSSSTTFSMTFGTDKGFVLARGVGDGVTYPVRQLRVLYTRPDGQQQWAVPGTQPKNWKAPERPTPQNNEALDQYLKTKKNLGTFKTEDAANAYAKILHEDQARGNKAAPAAAPAGDEFSQYVVKPPAQGGDDEFSQYVVKPEVPGQTNTSSNKNTGYQPLERTASNYATEGVKGIGRGIKNLIPSKPNIWDVLGGPAVMLGRTAFNLGKGTYEAGKAGIEAGVKDYGGDPVDTSVLTTMENLPIAGPMVKRAESGKGLFSPESFGAATEGITTAVAPEVVPKVAGGVLRSKYFTDTMPKHWVNAMIKPMAADVKFGKNPAQAILEEGIVGNNFRELGDRTFARMDRVGQQLDQAAAASKKRINAADALKPIDEEIKKAAKDFNGKLYEALTEARQQLLTEGEVRTTYKGGKATQKMKAKRIINPTNMSVADAIEFKRKIGRMIQWGNDPLAKGINATLGQAYHVVDDAVETQVPEIKDLNERYSNLTGAAQAIRRRTPVEARNAQWSLSDIVLGSHPATLPIAVGRKLMALPAIRTRMARGMYNMGEHTGPRQPMVSRPNP